MPDVVPPFRQAHGVPHGVSFDKLRERREETLSLSKERSTLSLSKGGN
ncbi:Uncharacterized protein dnm_044040 [Desulfonema magnum]|uniref:Uncharacterized protein n=1 Tax=Desulfonema magnum TaxID=45655 RepID=A0A975BNW0_9BACT|nr:Uncharacterized protein dnm_044040 [Desulfonema magnum]